MRKATICQGEKVFIVMVSILLFFCILFISPSAQALNSPIWEKQFYTDVFGDSTGEFYLVDSKPFSGTFNSATENNRPLSAQIIVDSKELNFILFENGTDQVKNWTNTSIQFIIAIKTTNGSKLNTTGTMRSGSDRITLDKDYYEIVVQALSANNGEVRFYMECTGQTLSNYLFTAECGNLAALYEEEFMIPIWEEQYQRGLSLLQDGQYYEAITIFEEIGNYKDSSQKLEEIRAQYESIIDQAAKYANSGIKREAAKLLRVIPLSDDNRIQSIWAIITGRRKTARYSNGLGYNFKIEVINDGTVVGSTENTFQFNQNNYGQLKVDNWSNIVAVAVGRYHSVGLRSDGTVVATGSNSDGQCNTGSWRDIVYICADCNYTIGLKKDGTVVTAGYVAFTSASGNSSTPFYLSSWKDIVCISATDTPYYYVGLKYDGTVVATGDNSCGQCNVNGWSDIVSIRTGAGYPKGGGARYMYTEGTKADGTKFTAGKTS